MKNSFEFEILAIENNDTTVRATLSDGETVVEQTIANVPVHDEIETRRFLTDYFTAYEQGLKVNTVTEIGAADGIIGKKLSSLSQEDLKEANSVV